MTAHGSTRQRAFEAACTLAAAGKRPTIAAVREELGGKGSQQAIGAGLDEAARRFLLGLETYDELLGQRVLDLS